MNEREILTATTDHVRGLLSGEGSGHDWFHIERVRNSALRIAREEQADLFVVELAALLHDVADWKFAGGDHDAGPQAARKWLQSHNLPLGVIDHVAGIIADLSFKGAGVDTPMKTIEGHCVQDADRLDALGAIGIARAFAYGGHKGRALYDPAIPPQPHSSFEAYKKNIGPTVNHFYEKLLLLKDRMTTATGKRLAAERHSYLERFLEQFLAEWNGEREFMRAEIISIGDELTTGQRLDTNSQWLAERLLEIGVPVAFHSTVGDQLSDNVLVFRQACERADIVVATGGLGPTADDLTRQALADVAGVPLVQDDASLAHIKALFSRRKREMPPANIVQAQFPQGSRPIHNPNGSAPGIDISIPHCAVGNALRGVPSARVFALPGVPAEMKEMWAATVGPTIQEHIGVKKIIAHHRIKCFGVGESDLEAMLPDIIARDRYPLVGITVSQATITLRVTAEGATAEAAREAMQPTIDTIHQCLGDLIFGYEDDELQDVVVRMLRDRKQTLSAKEWGTCGLVSSWLAETGAEDVFRGARVMTDRTAWNDSSIRSTPWADYEMIIGPCPEADSPQSVPGSMVILLVHGDNVIRKEFPFAGHPEILRPRAAKQALNLVRLHLLGKA